MAQLSELDSPRYKVEAAREDLNPRRLMQVDDAMADPRNRGPVQQKALGDERRRLEDMHQQMLEHAAMQQFTQRLEQRLNPRIGTPQDSDPQAARAAFMSQLMLQMQRRYPGMGGAGGPATSGNY